MPRAAEPHPRFLAAPPDRRWMGGSLAGLFTTLAAEARNLGGSDWARRILDGGAEVGMRLTLRGLKLRFVRQDEFKTANGPTLWRSEVDVFRRHMGVADWDEIPSPEGVAPAIATFLEPRTLFREDP